MALSPARSLLSTRQADAGRERTPDEPGELHEEWRSGARTSGDVFKTLAICAGEGPNLSISKPCLSLERRVNLKSSVVQVKPFSECLIDHPACLNN